MKNEMTHVTPYLFNEVFVCVCLFKDFIFLQLRSLYEKLKKIQDECILSQ